MRFLASLSILLISGFASWAADSTTHPVGAFHHEPAPLASSVAKSLVWIADARKMDEFLAPIDPTCKNEAARAYEVLPDTRVVWREYARQASAYAERGDDEGVAGRIGQMLKLAALYRQFGGLQNVAQAEEIRYLAGRTVQQLGYGGRIKSPYLESCSQDCMATIQRLAGSERDEVTPEFWQHLLAVAHQSFARLSGQSSRAAAVALSE
jgi:hypothetical protein